MTNQSNSTFDFDDGFIPDVEQDPNAPFDFDDGFIPDTPVRKDQTNVMDMATHLITPPKIYGQMARGLAGGMGDTVNLIPMAAGAINKGAAYALPEGKWKDSFNKSGDVYLSANLGDKVRNWIDSITGDKYKPKSTTDRVIDTASSFLAPGGVVGKGANVAQKVKKATLPAISAATALETTKGMHFLPESVPAREIIEDVVKTMVGSATPAALAKGFDIMQKPVIKMITKTESNNKQILEYAKQEGINLPYHVATDNDTAKFLANNLFRSYFVAGTWKDIVKNADIDMVKKVRRNIDNVAQEVISKESASTAFRDTAENVFKELKEKADTLYKPAVEAGKREIISTSSEQLKPLRKAIEEIKQKFDPSKVSLDSGSKFVYAKAIDIEKTLLSQKKISVDNLFDQRSSLLKDSKYGKAEGSKAWLSHVTSGIENSLEKIASNSSNKKFKELYSTAQSFYKNEYIARVKSTMGKALVTGDIPKEAYSFMNNVASIKQLEKILGKNVKTKPIMQDLKRAKLQEILIDKVFSNDGSLSHANLSNLFNKKSVYQDVLKELLGNENYRSMQRLSTLSARFLKSGRAYANPSGTSHSSKDKLMAHAITGSFGFGIGLKTASSSLITPWTLSKILSYKPATDKLVAISMKLNKGQPVKRDLHLLESMIVGINNEKNETQ